MSFVPLRFSAPARRCMRIERGSWWAPGCFLQVRRKVAEIRPPITEPSCTPRKRRLRARLGRGSFYVVRFVETGGTPQVPVGRHDLGRLGTRAFPSLMTLHAGCSPGTCTVGDARPRRPSKVMFNRRCHDVSSEAPCVCSTGPVDALHRAGPVRRALVRRNSWVAIFC
jgi:hypothetical protein